jgi:hypothetical protein
VQIAITNKQNVNTAAPFQQEISFSASTYSQYERGNLGNIRFYLGAPNTGQELYSWCGNFGSYYCGGGGNPTFWVRIPNGIPAYGTIYINMTFENKSVNYDGVYAGENPMATTSVNCPSNYTAGWMNSRPACFGNYPVEPYGPIEEPVLNYGEYDNGANVFNLYDNFAEGRAITGWQSFIGQNSSMKYVNQSLVLSALTSNGVGFIGTGGFSSTQYFDTYVYESGSWTGSLGIAWTSQANANSFDFAGAGGFGAEQIVQPYSSAVPVVGIPVGTTGLLWQWCGYCGQTNAMALGLPPWYTDENNFGILYVAMSTYPPNGVMPQTSFSQVQAP